MTWNTPLTELFGVRYPIMPGRHGAGDRWSPRRRDQRRRDRLHRRVPDEPRAARPGDRARPIAHRRALRDGLLFPDIDEATGSAPENAHHAVEPKLRNTMLNVAYDRWVALIVYAMKLHPGRADEAHERGIKVMTLVRTARHAVRAQERGADGVIATGTEAGGHTGAVALSALVRRCVGPWPGCRCGGQQAPTSRSTPSGGRE